MNRFAYIVISQLNLPPRQTADEYRCRFGVKTSYRLMYTVRARTTSRSAELRLFFVTLAFLLLNLWGTLNGPISSSPIVVRVRSGPISSH